MSTGAIDDIQTVYEYYAAYRKTQTMTAAAMQQMMDGAYIWLDYISVPQVNGGLPMPSSSICGTCASSASVHESSQPQLSRGQSSCDSQDSRGSSNRSHDAKYDTSDARLQASSFAPDREQPCRRDGSVGDYSGEETSDNDQRLSQAENFELAAAIESIPGYIELSSLFLIFAPTCRHCNRKPQFGMVPTTNFTSGGGEAGAGRSFWGLGSPARPRCVWWLARATALRPWSGPRT